MDHYQKAVCSHPCAEVGLESQSILACAFFYGLKKTSDFNGSHNVRVYHPVLPHCNQFRFPPVPHGSEHTLPQMPLMTPFTCHIRSSPSSKASTVCLWLLFQSHLLLRPHQYPMWVSHHSQVVLHPLLTPWPSLLVIPSPEMSSSFTSQSIKILPSLQSPAPLLPPQQSILTLPKRTFLLCL